MFAATPIVVGRRETFHRPIDTKKQNGDKRKQSLPECDGLPRLY